MATTGFIARTRARVSDKLHRRRRGKDNGALEMRHPVNDAMAAAGAENRPADEYSPPLASGLSPDNQNRVNGIKVRIMRGDVETDFVFRFPEGPLYAQDVVDSIAEKLTLSIESRKCFSLWIIGTELELQLKPGVELFDLVSQWHLMMLNFTHYPEAFTPSHPVNRFWFVYRREASLTKQVEQTFDGDSKVVSLLYGEAKRNVLTGRYVCSVENAVVLGGLQLTLMLGTYDPLKHREGVLVENMIYLRLLPGKLVPRFSPQEWETKFLEKYREYSRLSINDAELAYVQYVREWACYGSTLFPACHKRPPAGFFEFRKDRLYAGVGPHGLVVLDPGKNTYVFARQWNDVVITRTPDMVKLKYFENNKKRVFKLYSPQTALLCNLAMRCKYLFMKEAYLEKKHHQDVDERFQAMVAPLESMKRQLKVMAPRSDNDANTSSIILMQIDSRATSVSQSAGLPTPPVATIVPFINGNAPTASPTVANPPSRSATGGRARGYSTSSQAPAISSINEEEARQVEAFENITKQWLDNNDAEVQANSFVNYFANRKNPPHATDSNQVRRALLQNNVATSQSSGTSTPAHGTQQQMVPNFAAIVLSEQQPNYTTSRWSAVSSNSNPIRASVASSTNQGLGDIKHTAIDDSNDFLDVRPASSRRVIDNKGVVLNPDDSTVPSPSYRSSLLGTSFQTDADEIINPHRRTIVGSVKQMLHDDSFVRKADSLAPPRVTMRNGIHAEHFDVTKPQ